MLCYHLLRHIGAVVVPNLQNYESFSLIVSSVPGMVL